MGPRAGLSVRVRKTSPPPEFDPRTVHPVASRHIDYAVSAHISSTVFCSNILFWCSTLFNYTSKNVLVIMSPTETKFSHIICGKSNKIQLWLLCCGGCRGGANLRLNFKFQIFYSDSEVSVAHSKVTAGP